MFSPAESPPFHPNIQDVKTPTASGAAQCNKSCIELISQPLISQTSDLNRRQIVHARVANVELAVLFCGVVERIKN